MATLWVCWTTQGLMPRAGDVVLSFLPPGDEEALERGFPGALLRGRELSRGVRGPAREIYLGVSAALAATPGRNGRTLRQDAAGARLVSPWWHHPSSFKDCESDPAFGWIIAGLTVQEAARTHNLKDIIFWGAPSELVRALRPSFPRSKSFLARRRKPKLVWWARGLASRASLGWNTLRHSLAAADLKAKTAKHYDILLASFWDWSVWPEASGGLADRYYKALPQALAQKKLSVGWLAWLDPETAPHKKGRNLGAVLAPLKDRSDVVLLQRFLKPADVLAALFNFRPLWAYLRRRRRAEFKNLFRVSGLNLLPLMEERLLRGFLDGCLPRCALVALSAQRACRALTPRRVVSFLEHFPYARAFYEGARRADKAILCCAVQHASFCLEKTFYFLDPAREFRGEPDGLAAPCPDEVFAMGTLGRDHFLSCGYPKDRVHLTGSPRYDHVAAPVSVSFAPGAEKKLRLLIVASLDTTVEIDMVEAAWAAAEGLGGVSLTVRDHPFSRVEKHPRFSRFAPRVAVSSQTLEADIASADVLLFTYSTVAEEAFLTGKPVWQWLPLSYNASALVEACAVPQFSSTDGLRQAMKDFQENPKAFQPDLPIRKEACEKLFFRGDGQAAGRIAEALSR